MSDFDNERWEDRIAQRRAVLGTPSPRCCEAGCNESNPFALTGRHPEIRCYEHNAIRAGRSPIEDHHWVGKHNDAKDTGPVAGNDHRILSAYQAQWPIETLRNPEASPLLRAAAALRGWLDVLRHVIDRTIGWIPPFLEWLDTKLGASLGSNWWVDMDWQSSQ